MRETLVRIVATRSRCICTWRSDAVDAIHRTAYPALLERNACVTVVTDARLAIVALQAAFVDLHVRQVGNATALDVPIIRLQSVAASRARRQWTLSAHRVVQLIPAIGIRRRIASQTELTVHQFCVARSGRLTRFANIAAVLAAVSFLFIVSMLLQTSTRHNVVSHMHEAFVIVVVTLLRLCYVGCPNAIDRIDGAARATHLERLLGIAIVAQARLAVVLRQMVAAIVTFRSRQVVQAATLHDAAAVVEQIATNRLRRQWALRSHSVVSARTAIRVSFGIAGQTKFTINDTIVAAGSRRARRTLFRVAGIAGVAIVFDR